MARDREADGETLRAIQRSARAGNHAQAAALAQAARADGLEHPLIYNVLALRHELEGAVGEAEALLQHAVRLAPLDPAARNALGLCLLRLERPAQALAQFDALLAANPTLAFAHANRGSALSAQGRMKEAEVSFQRAVELDPRQPVALTGLGTIASWRGDYGQARARVEKALELLPDYPDAILTLASVELGEKRPALAESRIRTLLSRSDLDARFRAHANGLLGDALDAQSRTAEAFAAYSLCNEMLREAHAPEFNVQPSATQYVRSLVEHLRHADSSAWRDQPPQQPGPASDHIFVLGFPRSGTTLLEVVLEGHPRVTSLEENELLMDGVLRFMQRPADLDGLLRCPPSTLNELRAMYWRRVAAGGVDVTGKVFVDKNPLNTLKLPLIARLFPRAKILLACRDPRDVVLSCFRHRFFMSAPIYELLTLQGAADYYDAVMRLALECNRLLPLQICLVRHEDVVTAFAREMRRLCEFAGLEWVPAMGDFALRTRGREFLTPSTAQLVKGLNTEGLGHWLRYREQLEPVLPTLEPWVKQFLYEDQAGAGRLNQQLKATVIRSPSPSKGVTS
ncbi:MAG TPA: sulfotransferase [Steroidobacteraceae bacterium]|nr:sulfotransferase [Steroidobacteraceae bacterium]